MIYYLLLFFLFILSVITIYNTNKYWYYSYIGVFVICLIGGFRYQVGYDWQSYNSLFYSIQSLQDILYTREEKLFTFFCLIINSIYSNFSFFIFIFFSFFLFLKYQFLKKYSPNTIFSYIIYIGTVFLIFDLNGLRQSAALTIVLFTYKYIIDRNFLIFNGLMIIAILFHTSAIIFYPFYWICNLKFSNKLMIVIIILSFLISNKLQLFIATNPYLNILLDSDSLTHYNVYLKDENTVSKISYFPILLRMFTLFIFLFNYYKININDKYKNFLKNASFISLVFFIIISFAPDPAYRLSFYFKIFELISIPFIIISQNNNLNKIIYLIIFTVLNVISISRILELPDNGLIPYNFLFFN